MHKMFFFFSHISWYIVDKISCNISNIADIVYRDIIIIVGQISSQYRIVSYPYHPTPNGCRVISYGNVCMLVQFSTKSVHLLPWHPNSGFTATSVFEWGHWLIFFFLLRHYIKTVFTDCVLLMCYINKMIINVSANQWHVDYSFITSGPTGSPGSTNNLSAN